MFTDAIRQFLQKVLYTFAVLALFSMPGVVQALDDDFSNGISVDSVLDAVDANVGDAICADAAGNCTLRAALAEANFTSGLQNILLPAGTFLLTIPPAIEDTVATGDLDIYDTVTLVGAGPTLTRIDANGPVIGDRAFHLKDISGVGVSALLEGIAVVNGQVLNVNGGGILVEATEGGGPPPLDEVTVSLILRNVEVSGNFANSNAIDPVTGKPIGGAGGGIYNSASLTLENSQILGNAAITNGGGFYSGGVVTLTGSVVFGNTAEGGGGIFETGSHISTYTNCGVVNNHAVGGGGISTRAQVSLELLNCTIHGNTATDVGAGIQNNGVVNLVYCTVTGNTSDSEAPNGGAALNSFANGSFRLWSTLLADNIVAAVATPTERNCGCTGGICSPMVQFLSLGFNLEDIDSCALTQPEDLPNTNPGIQPLLWVSPLAPVRPLAWNSAAIDTGDPELCPATDLRGGVRPLDGDLDGTSACDIGTYEFAPTIFADGFESSNTAAWSLTVGLVL